MRQASKIFERENKRLEQQIDNKISRINQMAQEHRDKESKFRDIERDMKSESINLKNEIRNLKSELIQAKG